jgi:hypothetical protein
MEGIEHSPQIWMTYPANVSSRRCCRVKKVAFKSVQKLNRQTHALTLRLIRHLTVNVCRELEFFLSRSRTGEYPQSLVQRPT